MCAQSLGLKSKDSMKPLEDGSSFHLQEKEVSSWYF